MVLLLFGSAVSYPRALGVIGTGRKSSGVRARGSVGVGHVTQWGALAIEVLWRHAAPSVHGGVGGVPWVDVWSGQGSVR